jgi:hypothetical protein
MRLSTPSSGNCALGTAADSLDPIMGNIHNSYEAHVSNNFRLLLPSLCTFEHLILSKRRKERVGASPITNATLLIRFLLQ